MDTVKDRITNPTQARAFANATRNTPRLLALIKQGVYAPTAFTGTAGAQAAAKIEAQLAYASGARTGARRAVGPAVREYPTSTAGANKYRRPRFTYARA